MKRMVFIGLMLLAGWSYWSKRNEPEEPFHSEAPTPLISPPTTREPTVQPLPGFKCDGREHCSQMNSREEAEFFVRNCPNTKMDGDHDGEPCENDSRF